MPAVQSKTVHEGSRAGFTSIINVRTRGLLVSNLYSQDIVLTRIEGRMRLVQDRCSQVASPRKMQQQLRGFGSRKSTSKGPLYKRYMKSVPLEARIVCHNILFMNVVTTRVQAQDRYGRGYSYPKVLDTPISRISPWCHPITIQVNAE